MSGQRDFDSQVVAHLQRLASIARTAAGAEIVSFRRRAPTRAELDSTARDPTAPAPEAWAEDRDPAGHEDLFLAALLRTYPTAQSMRDGGARGPAP